MAGNLAPTNILDLANYVQQQGDLGRQQGTAQRFNRLAGEAYTAPAGQNRLALLGQAVQTDPSAGMALGNQLAARDSAQQATEVDHMKKLRGAAQFSLDALKSGDPARIQGAGNAVGPYLTQLTGKPFTGLTQDMLPALYQVLAQTGGMPEQKGVVLSAGGQLRNPMTGELLADNPQSLQYHDVPMGQGKSAGVFDPSTGQLRPAAGAAQNSAGDPMQPYIAQANQAMQLGADPSKVQAWLMQQAQQIGAQPQGGTMGAPAPAGMGQPSMPQPQAAPAQFGVGTPKPGAGDTFAKNKAFADQLQASGVITTPEEYQQVLATGKVGNDFQGGGSVRALGDINLSGHDYIQSVPADERGIVKGLLNGTVALPTGSTLKNAFWQSALASVKHADPSWNQAAFKQYADTRKYMTIGQGGKLINSINTGAQHLQKLVEDINALNNSGSTDWNAIANNVAGRTGNQAVTNFMGDVTPVASELAAIYKNGGTPTDQETAHWREALHPNMSKAQQLNVVRGWIDLLAGKLTATREQYQSAMSPLSEPLDVINPKAKDALAKITALANGVSTTGQHPMPTLETTPINAPGQQAGGPQPGQVEDGFRFKGGDPANPASWERM